LNPKDKVTRATQALDRLAARLASTTVRNNFLDSFSLAHPSAASGRRVGGVKACFDGRLDSGDIFQYIKI